VRRGRFSRSNEKQAEVSIYMRTVVIVATIAVGALRLAWRSVRVDPVDSEPEWTADVVALAD